jgi:hypothetical protein
MTGYATSDTLKPVPVTEAPLTVTGAVPLEVKVTACGGAGVFT